ncbi:hypothetical protein [Streptomyces sp. NPDC088847]|uniref:hypothetical protein n=1 Tax=Streptomyces sp. NPDC088847 TaxID=3365909 RepID=UPI003802521D
MTSVDTVNVLVYDIDWDPHWTSTGAPREPWDRLTAEAVEAGLALSREMGETVSEQEHLTTDRDGRAMRIVLLKVKPEAHLDDDLGAVYEYAL